jgi:hypothetical protein
VVLKVFKFHANRRLALLPSKSHGIPSHPV